jgi:hypothetical protein
MSHIPDFDELNLDPNAEVGPSSQEYEPSTSTPKPPLPGKYKFRGVQLEKLTWGVDKNKNLYCRGNFQISSGESEGRYVDGFISSRKNMFREGNDLQDLMFATNPGVKSADGLHFTTQETAGNVISGWGNEFSGQLGWEGYCKECGKTTIRGKKTKVGKNGVTYTGFDNEEGDLLYVKPCPECSAPVSARGKLTQVYSD